MNLSRGNQVLAVPKKEKKPVYPGVLYVGARAVSRLTVGQRAEFLVKFDDAGMPQVASVVAVEAAL